MDASVAAFTKGGPWLDLLLAHLVRARDHLGRMLASRLPGVSWVPPEATYLARLDCRTLGLGSEPSARFLERGRVAVTVGAPFGFGCGGFVRLSCGTSRPILTEIVRRLASAIV